MRKMIEGSRAVAEAVALCRPDVISAYPITPQTHIVEALGEMVKAGTEVEISQGPLLLDAMQLLGKLVVFGREPRKMTVLLLEVLNAAPVFREFVGEVVIGF